MGLKIGEFFTELGVVGAEKTIGALGEINKGMGEVWDKSLAMKAAIVGAFYALEQMFSLSGQTGSALQNFNALTGISVKTLQQYQYAMRQIGGTNEDVAGTFQNLQAVVAKALMGMGTPKGIGLIAPTIGMTDQQFYESMSKPEVLLQELQKFARSKVAPAIRNEILKGFGLSDTMIAAMVKNTFRPEILAQAPYYTERQTAALQKNAAEWGNIATKIEMAFGKFNAMHGGEIVKDIDKITSSLLRLIGALGQLSNQAGIFKLMAVETQGWSAIMDHMTNFIEKKDKEREVDKMVYEAMYGPKGVVWGPSMGGPKAQEIQLHQYFEGVVNPRQVEDASKKGIQDAHRQLQANNQVN